NVLGHGPYLLSNRFSLSAIENRTHRTGYAPTTSKLRKNPDVIQSRARFELLFQLFHREPPSQAA
ncbi:MAG: hypothetical protein LKF99_06820, partial [Bifidobacterium sp.]|nr:hypothetical protein [Bifidobacterium sp.]